MSQERPKPIFVSLGHRDSEEAYAMRLGERLKRGEIPEFLIEHARLVGEGDSPEGDLVIAYVRGLMEKLAATKPGQPKPPLKIYLSDQDSMSTGVIVNEVPVPILTEGLDLIDIMIANGFGEDHAVGINGHERFHVRRHELWGNLENGRPEENIADVYGVLEAERLGYNPSGSGEVLKLLRDKYKEKYGFVNVLHRFQDPHGNLNNRIRNTDNAVGTLQLSKRLKQDVTPFPPEIVEAIRKIRFKTVFERYMERTNYAAASPTEKLDLLMKYFIDALENEDPKLRKIMLYQAINEMQALKNQPGVAEAAKPWLEHFMRDSHAKNADFDWSRDFSNHDDYYWILRHTIEFMAPLPPAEPNPWETERDREYRQEKWQENFDHRIDPAKAVPEQYRALSIQSRAFWNAKTKEEAVAAANTYEAAYKALSVKKGDWHVLMPGISALNSSPDNNFRIDINERGNTFLPIEAKMPYRREVKDQIDKEGVARFPWSNHLKWAKAGDPDAKLIADTCKRLGCPDKRMPGNEDFNLYYADNLGYGSWDDLTFNEEGDIIAVKPTREELMADIRKRFKADSAAHLLRKEYDRQQKRDEAEDTLVASTDWSEMESDFWGFVEKNYKHLQPEMSVVPGRFPFAAEFVRRLEALKAADPKWEADYQTFFTGQSPRVEDATQKRAYNEWDYDDDNYTREKKMKPSNAHGERLAFPGMIADFVKTYWEYSPQDFRGRRGEATGHPAQAYARWLVDRQAYNERIYGERVARPFYIDDKEKTFEDDQVELKFFVGAAHPFVKPFAAFGPEQINSERKAKLLRVIHYQNCDARSDREVFRIDPAVMAGYKRPLDMDEFRQAQDSWLAGNQDSLIRVMQEALPYELLWRLRELDTQEKPERFPIAAVHPYYLTHDFAELYDGVTAKALSDELRILATRQIERNIRADFEGNLDLQELIDRFLEDHAVKRPDSWRRGGKYLTEEERRAARIEAKAQGVTNWSTHNVYMIRPGLEMECFEKIKQRILALPLPDQAGHLTNLMRMPIADPDMRNWAIDAWVKSTVCKLGKDDGTPEYKEKAMKFFDTCVGYEEINETQGLNCILKILVEIEAQHDVALETKQLLIKRFGQRFLEKDGTMRVLESVTDHCAQKEVLRDGFLKFMTEPLTYNGSSVFAKLLKENLPEDAKYVKDIRNAAGRVKMSEDQENMLVDAMHKNFWAMPFELRTIYIDRVLFPTHLQNTDKVFGEAVTFVLDKVLPVDRKFASEAREALTTYLDCCPVELRRLTFSALLASIEHASKAGAPMRPGQVLSYVLSRTGAAGGQLLQAGHSYLNGMEITDPDLIQFRDDLKASKFDFDPPLPWQVFERIDAAVPDHIRNTIKRVRMPVLGSGSTAFVVHCEKTQGPDTALKLMRKDVISIADVQFERYGAAFVKLAAKHAHYKPLPGMVDHARDLIKVSAVGTVAAEQVAYAQSSFEPIKVLINGKEYGFKVAGMISCGAEFLETELVVGPHINDLPIDTPAQRLDKKESCIAEEAAEVLRMLQGYAIDQDRHGNQQKKKGRTLQIFDVGGIAYNLKQQQIAHPQDHEKRALGRLIGLTINKAVQGQPYVQAMVDGVTDYEWGDAKNYLVGIKRAMLARADKHKGFGVTPKERADVHLAIIKAAWKKGLIDPQILRGAIETIDSKAALKILEDIDHQIGSDAIEIHDASVTTGQQIVGVFNIVKTIASAGLRRVFNTMGIGEAPAVQSVFKSVANNNPAPVLDAPTAKAA